MKTFFTSILCLVLFPILTVAQESPFSGASNRFVDAKGNLDYVSPIKYLLENEHKFDKGIFAQAWDNYYSFVGAGDSIKSRHLLNKLDKDLVNKFVLADPLKVIMPKARNASVVLINEAHHVPAHRAFAATLLDSLYAAGYTILSLEALFEDDSTLNSRKYPVSSSGFYTREPAFGNFIREAIAKGFTVVGHEHRQDQTKEISDPLAQSNYRDSIQAVNLLATLKANPGAKVLGYVGYDHILEKERGGYKRLGTYLKEAGVDALTIDQISSCDCVTGKSPAALTSDGVSPAIAGSKNGYVDIQVVHPPVTLVDGRPRWLTEDKSRKAFASPLPPYYRNKKTLVQVYNKEEFDAVGDRAIPIDQLVTDGRQDKVKLFIPKGVKHTLVRHKVLE